MKNALSKSKEFERFLQNALSLIAANGACPSDFECNLDVVLNDDIFANFDGQKLLISSGLINGITQLNIKSSKQHEEGLAYTWLFLHELSHLWLGHFELAGGQPLLGVVSRKPKEWNFPTCSAKVPNSKVLLCLELQADHDALEMLLNDYFISKWSDIRKNAASIVTVLVLIENADTVNCEVPSTHPKAATRIFQLFGHLVDMWSIPANAKAKAHGELSIHEDDLPSHEERLAFSKKVILPAFWDAVELAEVAGAKSIVADLGSPEVFFEDIGRAKLGQWDELVTVGAKEWAELKELNASVLENLGHSSI